MTTYDERVGAVISLCGFYRYRLWRRWNLELPVLLWIMLNPSTADETQNDATINAITDFSTRLGYGGLEVANLYAYRTKSPAVLKSAGYPVGPDNELTLRALAHENRKVVCAWGGHAQRERVEAVYEMLAERANPLCLAHNQDGSPKHPLYIKRDTLPVPWNPYFRA